MSTVTFDQISEHEQVMFCNDPHTGLKAIIAIHNTTLGPALGGCRMLPYKSEEEALTDVLRLSKGMTYKCVAADVDFGGGKAVIIGDPRKDKTPELFRAFGQFVQSLNGRFYTGTDMGTTPEDFVQAYKETSFIVGLPEEYGGNGDSSVTTAFGVMQGLRAVSQFLWGTDVLTERVFAVQGLGKVGFKVAEGLLKEGANVYVTDVDPETIAKLEEKAYQYPGHVQAVTADDIYGVGADVFVPCAIGGIINDETIERLKVKAVCGAANNQLLEDRHGKVLQAKNILYAPDYIVNAGGLIQVSDELYGPNKARVLKKTRALYDTLFEIFQSAEKKAVSTVEAANQFVEERLQKRARLNSFFSPDNPPKWRVRR
ncbi:Glu/Leu/Phe/Val dehydrogenase dimerization region [Caldalkalibacillus thermarum TA2.A1]|uniref:Phenylalanine dehydrogenase n=2 Tax=Caldalkalibacillus thermarum (strain TA2.A1) TaxID=986075 RepID=DHPH_CALTT|nr:Glu/Leu/Phe/Val dehydrogenase [Caldalkalibacillus thermarum]F5L9G2.1 RecName: Full=Phenylalanine dehydrogenase; Short=PheDH [Caldalkalibacillus thermarum TA2.A1]EGL81949.1 Glu/Leu/Phe/Val dehydrogenase dimerization region [Caldalkalibacillus thermarum TA2.A1]QZT34478.1 Glu/Leu/Phe/Val dehydrogenase [Caldalkalibacillus thermarum TA2.A1]